MSASIYFAQVKPIEGKRISAWCPSSFMESIEKVFGTFPCDFGSDDIDKLSGMAAMCHDQGGNPYQQIIDAVEKYGVIRVWAQF